MVWDRRSGEPIHRAIVWQSRQSAGICDALRARGLADEVAARTGLVIDAYFSGTKIRFILDAVPGAQQRAERGELAFGTVDSWLLHKLTRGRVHATEFSNAARTLVFNIHTLDWDDLLLGELRIPRAMLPEVTRFERCLRQQPIPSGSARRSRSRASPATSRPRSSVRAARPRVAPRTPTARAASCLMNTGSAAPRSRPAW